MKKGLFILGCVASCLSAHANYMYWQVTTADFDSTLIKDVVSARVGYTYDGVNPDVTATKMTSYASAGSDAGFEQVPLAINDQQVVRVNFADIGGSPSSYSYYIELLNSSGDVVGRSGKNSTYQYATYSSLANYSVETSISSVPTAAVWHGGGFEAVPEPSSMALLALGAGLVGLRRKLKKGKKAKKEKCA